jgi:pimeloyl-ACP methyl ester carboxylesterase
MSLKDIYLSGKLSELYREPFEQLDPLDPDKIATGSFDTEHNHIRYSAYMGGEARPLTFVPAGLLGCQETVSRLAIAGANLGENVVVFDQPRHNIDRKDPVKIHLETLKRVVDTVRDSNLLERVVVRPDLDEPIMLTPHSFGNDAAIAYAVERPRDVASIVGIAPHGYDKWQAWHFLRNAGRLHEDALRMRQDATAHPDVHRAVEQHIAANRWGFLYEVAYCALNATVSQQSKSLLETDVPIGVMGFAGDNIIDTDVLRKLPALGIDYTEFPDKTAHHNTTFTRPSAVMSLAQTTHRRLQGTVLEIAS